MLLLEDPAACRLLGPHPCMTRPRSPHRHRSRMDEGTIAAPLLREQGSGNRNAVLQVGYTAVRAQRVHVPCAPGPTSGLSDPRGCGPDSCRWSMGPAAGIPRRERLPGACADPRARYVRRRSGAIGPAPAELHSLYWVFFCVWPASDPMPQTAQRNDLERMPRSVPLRSWTSKVHGAPLNPWWFGQCTGRPQWRGSG